MLVLSRNKNQDICFPELGIRVEVLEISRNKVKVGVDAPKDVQILRGELLDGNSQVKTSATVTSEFHAIMSKCSATLRACSEAGYDENDNVDMADLLSDLISLMEKTRRQMLVTGQRQAKLSAESPPRKIAPSEVHVSKTTLTA